MAQRSYAGAAPVTELAAGITAGSSSFTVVSGGGAGYPTGSNGPFFLVLDEGTASEEKVLVSNRTGDVFTFAGGGRGADDTAPLAHTLPCAVRHIHTATDSREANDHINTDAGVHGVDGNLVGDTDAQTLTNKTIDGGDNTLQNIGQSSVTDLPGDISALEARATALEDITSEFSEAGASFVAAPLASADRTNYPDGLSARNATQADGWPANGILLTWNYGTARATQELTHSSTGSSVNSRYIRHWNDSSSDWTSWMRVAEADSTSGLVQQENIQRGVLNLEGEGTDFNIGSGNERGRTTFNTLDNVGPFGNPGSTAIRSAPFSGLYLVTQMGRYLTTGGSTGEEVELRVRTGGSSSDATDGSIVGRTAGNFGSSGTPEAYVTMAEVMRFSSGDLIKLTSRNNTGTTITEDGNPDFKTCGIIYLGPN